jgi:exodeoxyribonuclease X
MASSSDTLTPFRIVDVETTGTTPNDAVVEIGAVDLVGGEIIPIGSDLVRPPVPIPPQASPIHQITGDDVSRSPTLEEVLPFYMDVDRAVGVDVLVAHHWAFEAQWLRKQLLGRPAICTYKAALRVWPEAPGHSNQTLRYWLRPKGLIPAIASTPHRALPGAYVTAFLLRELLELATVEELIAWTMEPALLPRVIFGRYRGSNWGEVPADYLAWVAERSELGGDVRFTAQHHRSLRLDRVTAA